MPVKQLDKSLSPPAVVMARSTVFPMMSSMKSHVKAGWSTTCKQDQRVEPSCGKHTGDSCQTGLQ